MSKKNPRSIRLEDTGYVLSTASRLETITWVYERKLWTINAWNSIQKNFSWFLFKLRSKNAFLVVKHYNGEGLVFEPLLLYCRFSMTLYLSVK